MKKLDFLVIGLVLIIVATFVGLFFNRFLIDTSKAKLEIVYKDMVIDSIDYKEDIDIIYEIRIYEEDLNRLEVKKKVGEIQYLSYFEVTSTFPITNIIHVTYEHTHMDDASCENKICMKGYMSTKRILPIVCTNGVIVRFVETKDHIDDVLVP
ncbi:MAG: hypothetical protein PHP41_02115 [Bacilli bacterium]|jgi:hypothetical protein|nr:hypothetical protein [Bacilli bacterium]MDY0064377.1 hypothetical protein [Bacilli bacterium]